MPQTAVLNFYDSLGKIGTIDPAAPVSDDFVVTEVYRTALDALIEREPEEQLWRELDTLYWRNNG